MGDETRPVVEPPKPLSPEDREKVARTRATLRKQAEDSSKDSSTGSAGRSGGSSAKSKKLPLVERTPDEIARIRKIIEQGFDCFERLGDPKATDADKDRATRDWMRASWMLVVEKWLPHFQYFEEANAVAASVTYGGWRGYKFARTLTGNSGASLSKLGDLTDMAAKALDAMNKRDEKKPDAPKPATEAKSKDEPVAHVSKIPSEPAPVDPDDMEDEE